MNTIYIVLFYIQVGVPSAREVMWRREKCLFIFGNYCRVYRFYVIAMYEASELLDKTSETPSRWRDFAVFGRVKSVLAAHLLAWWRPLRRPSPATPSTPWRPHPCPCRLVLKAERSREGRQGGAGKAKEKGKRESASQALFQWLWKVSEVSGTFVSVWLVSGSLGTCRSAYSRVPSSVLLACTARCPCNLYLAVCRPYASSCSVSFPPHLSPPLSWLAPLSLHQCWDLFCRVHAPRLLFSLCSVHYLESGFSGYSVQIYTFYLLFCPCSVWCASPYCLSLIFSPSH